MPALELLETSSPAVALPQQALENGVLNRQTAPLTNPPARLARTPPSTSGNRFCQALRRSGTEGPHLTANACRGCQGVFQQRLDQPQSVQI